MMDSLFDKASRFIASAGAILAGGAALLMMLHICTDVAFKYLGLNPIPATMEITTAYYMVPITFLPLISIQRCRKHVVVELLIGNLSGRKRRITEINALLATAAYCFFLAVGGVTEALDATARNEFRYVGYFDLSVWQSRWFVPAGIGGMALVALGQAIREIRAPSGESSREQ
ncbi:MAG: TRAP transporter small permease [Rhodovibrionaceae bacterium]